MLGASSMQGWGWIIMKIALATLAGLCLAPPAFAAATPPSSVIMGTAINGHGAGDSNHLCAATSGPALFQRAAATANAPNPTAILSLPGLGTSAFPPDPTYSFVGVVRLQFTSATAGNARFDYDLHHSKTLPSSETIEFSDYSQVWAPSAGTLKVSFNVLFKDCTLPVLALFRTIP